MTFLEQLQQTAGLLGEQVQNVNPFGNYSDFRASDFLRTPFGENIAQIRQQYDPVSGNQFLFPDLTGSTYTPGNFSLAPGAGFNFGNFGSYTPLPFNQGNVATTTTQPGLLAGVERAMGGGGRDIRGGMWPNVSTEFVGDRGFRINADGSVSMLDPNSLDYKFNNLARGLLSVTPSNLLRQALQGEPTIAQRATVNPNNAVYNRIAETYGEETAQEFMKQNAEAINKELQSDEYKKMMSDLQAKATTPSGALTPEEALLENLKKQKEGLKTKSTKNDPGGLNKAREAAKDRAAAATGKSRGFFGGR